MGYNYANEISFWNFLQKFNVKIPIIQRDYAQGRLGEEYLRNNFLVNLKQALDDNLPNEEKSLKLDFVYGEEKNGILYPLDGQQRLTTLWLLHWYVALRSDKLENVAEILKNFTYETRISSREFCENLCNPVYFKEFDGNNVVDYVVKQTWFCSIWQQDPTIQSMLRMLKGCSTIDDGIEKIFSCSKNDFDSYWEKLSGENCPIVFFHLSLPDFGLSDDLYVKMNARGKQLTGFENFKADLIGYIKQFENESDEWKTLLDPKDGIPIKFDTIWTDLFWRYRSKGIENEYLSNSIDEIFFSFLNRFFWNELFSTKKSDGTNILYVGKEDDETIDNDSYRYLNDSDNSKDYDLRVAYKGLDVYKYDSGKISLSFFLKLRNILDNVSKFLTSCNIPKCAWDDLFCFIPQYIEEQGHNVAIKNNSSETILKVTALNQVQRVVFFALCKFFDYDANVLDSKSSLNCWMRVVWNLVSGEDQNGKPQIRSLSAMRTAMDFINKLDCRDVYNSLIKQKISGQSDFDERCKEEVAKAKQILDGKSRSDGRTWEEVIIEAENYAFFRGSIRFLFRDENGEVTEKSWNDFDKKWKIAQKYFDKNGLKEEFKVSLTKALVIQCNKWNYQLYNKQIFNPNASTWKWILCSDYWINPINEILLSENIENIKGVEENDDEKVKKYITPILTSLPYGYFIQNVPEGRFFWYKGRLGFYKPQSHSAAAFDWENFHRNAILTHLAKKAIITVDAANMANSGIFWGWDIFFNYSNNERKYRFQWNVNGSVRLMDEKNLPCKCDDHYYSFEFDGENPNEFEKKLKELIKDFSCA